MHVVGPNVEWSQNGIAMQAGVDTRISDLTATKSEKHQGICNNVSPVSQCLTLTTRSLLNACRDIGVFWIRMGIYIALSVALGTIHMNIRTSWRDTVSRSGLLMFSMTFLTFMAISGFPSFVEEMRVCHSHSLVDMFWRFSYELCVLCQPPL